MTGRPDDLEAVRARVRTAVDRWTGTDTLVLDKADVLALLAPTLTEEEREAWSRTVFDALPWMEHEARCAAASDVTAAIIDRLSGSTSTPEPAAPTLTEEERRLRDRLHQRTEYGYEEGYAEVYVVTDDLHDALAIIDRLSGSTSTGGKQVVYIERPEVTAEREAGWVNFHPEDICHACGGENPSWHADTELWYEAMGVRDTDGGGIVCPNCFIALWHDTTDREVIWRLSILEVTSSEAEVARLSAALEVAREALETSLLVAAEAAVHAGINGPMHSGQNSSDALDLIESMARTALARIDKEAHDA